MPISCQKLSETNKQVAYSGKERKRMDTATLNTTEKIGASTVSHGHSSMVKFLLGTTFIIYLPATSRVANHPI